MIEAMRILKAVGARPRRTIRVALWGGEEQGLLGSRAYIQQHYAGEANAAAREKLAMYLNLDPGMGPIYGWYMENSAPARAQAVHRRFPEAQFAFNWSSSFKWYLDRDPMTFAELGDMLALERRTSAEMRRDLSLLSGDLVKKLRPDQTFQALSHVSFDVPAGQTLGVITAVHNTPFGDINDVELDQPDGSDAGSGQIQRRRRTKAPGTDAQDASRFQALLPLDADLIQGEMPAEPHQFVLRELHSLDDTDLEVTGPFA